MQIFKRSEDHRPVGLVVLFFLYQLSIFFWVDNLWLALLLIAVPHYVMQIPIVSAAHAAIHTPMFYARWPDFVLGLIYSLEVGYTRHCFKLDHVLHHRYYLDPAKDTNSSLWHGKVVGRFRYSFYNLFTVYPRTFGFARNKSAHVLRSYLLEVAVMLVALAVFTAIDPAKTLVVFGYAMVLGLYGTYYWSHHEHAGLLADNHLHASRNYINPFYNWLASNVGYHTAHHMKPGMHWADLPAYHEQIKDQIPPELIITYIPFFSSNYGPAPQVLLPVSK